jgi:hypothetical protein
MNTTEEKIIQWYKSGLSTLKIGKMIGKHDETVRKILIKYGIPRRTRREINKKYIVDSHYFDKVNSHEKAYILGLLFSDGYNDEKEGYISLILKEEDKYILEKINSIIQPLRGLYLNHYHKGRVGKKYYYIYITDKRISQKLAELGCVQRKSLILEFPSIPACYVPSFVLGYFDGDGGISKNKHGDYSMYFYGAEKFLRSLQDILKNTLKIVAPLEQTPYSVCRLTFRRKKFLIRLIKWMYKKQGWFLNRKYLLCNEFMKTKGVPFNATFFHIKKT